MENTDKTISQLDNLTDIKDNYFFVIDTPDETYKATVSKVSEKIKDDILGDKDIGNIETSAFYGMNAYTSVKTHSAQIKNLFSEVDEYLKPAVKELRTSINNTAKYTSRNDLSGGYVYDLGLSVSGLSAVINKMPTSARFNELTSDVDTISNNLTAINKSFTDHASTKASDDSLGHIQIGYFDNGNNYGVKLADDGTAYVTVPASKNTDPRVVQLSQLSSYYAEDTVDGNTTNKVSAIKSTVDRIATFDNEGDLENGILTELLSSFEVFFNSEDDFNISEIGISVKQYIDAKIAEQPVAAVSPFAAPTFKSAVGLQQISTDVVVKSNTDVQITHEIKSQDISTLPSKIDYVDLSNVSDDIDVMSYSIATTKRNDIFKTTITIQLKNSSENDINIDYINIMLS